MNEFDYVVIGAGSAGCVLANRLTEDPKISVCILEAGGSDKSVLVRAPLGVAAMLPTSINNWQFETVPQPGLNNRKGYQPRGKVLGGSSSTNAMLYVRGNKWDYDNWESLGNPGWSYKDVLPYFKKAENNETHRDDYHGIGGPLNVAEATYRTDIADKFIEAANLFQIPTNPDINGAVQDGAHRLQVTHINGERCSAAKAYLTPVMGRPNLKVITSAHINKIMLKNMRAVGVSYFQGNALEEVRARKEVLLSAGAFGSPQILMLSGVGPMDELKSQGIDVIHELPGVGQNLQDHIDFVDTFRSKNMETFGVSLRSMIKMPLEMVKWANSKKGMVSSALAESGAFVKSAPDIETPDLQLIFVIGIVDDHSRKLHLGHGFSCHATVLRPKSTGYVGLNSANPKDAPKIDPRFFSDEADMDVMIKGARIQRKIMESSVFDPYRDELLYPMDINDDDAVREAIRNRADTQYHPTCTCKMGPDTDPMAVVDAQLRVKGVEGLRVVDASIMPKLCSGNTNAPTIMIAEKAADLIKAGQ